MDKPKKLFEEEDLTSFRKIVVHFKNNDDVDKFSKLIGQKITPKQPSLRYLDEKIEDEGVRRGRETEEYLKSLGYMGGKKDKVEKK